MSINTPRRCTKHVPVRGAHGKLACDSLLQSAALSLLSSKHVFQSHPPLLPHTPPTPHPNTLHFLEHDVTLAGFVSSLAKQERHQQNIPSIIPEMSRETVLCFSSEPAALIYHKNVLKLQIIPLLFAPISQISTNEHESKCLLSLSCPC